MPQGPCHFTSWFPLPAHTQLLPWEGLSLLPCGGQQIRLKGRHVAHISALLSFTVSFLHKTYLRRADRGCLPEPTQPLSHFPSSAGHREKRWKRSWVEIKTGRSLTNYCHGQISLDLGKINLTYCQLKTIGMVGTHPHLFPGLASLLHSQPLYLLAQYEQQRGMGLAVSLLQFICAAPSSSHFSPAPK